MSEDLLYHISGSCGVMIAGIICAVYVKKKNYVRNIGKVETFSLKKAFYLAGLTVCICQIIINEINDSTRNINYCIVAHAFCNLFASVMNALEQMEITCFGMALQYEKNGYVMCHFILVIVAVLFCASCFFRMKKNKGHNKQLWKGEEG